MKEIFIESMNQWQIVIKQFNFIGMFDTLEEGRKEAIKLFNGGDKK